MTVRWLVGLWGSTIPLTWIGFAFYYIIQKSSKWHWLSIHATYLSVALAILITLIFGILALLKNRWRTDSVAGGCLVFLISFVIAVILILVFSDKAPMESVGIIVLGLMVASLSSGLFFPPILAVILMILLAASKRPPGPWRIFWSALIGGIGLAIGGALGFKILAVAA